MATLSVIVHTKNSATTLEACLASVKKIADELIIMDMGSTDDTLKIAKQFKARILTHPDVGYADPARNKALQAASQDWLLVVDSDEEVPPQLATEISSLIDNPGDAVAFAFPRQNLIFGQWAKSGWWPDYQRRLFKRGHVNWPPELHGVPEINGPLKVLPPEQELALRHHNYNTIDDFIDRAQRYSSLAAAEILAKKRQGGTSLIGAWLQEYLKRWFVDEAQQQARYGQTLAFLQSSFEALSLAKYWEQHSFNSNQPLPKLSVELAKAARDARYWEAHQAWQNARGLNKLYWRIRLRLKV